MNVQGWEIHPQKLPYWDNHRVFPYCEDHLYESPDGGSAVLIYSVIEVGMMNYQGFCAVYQNRTAPVLRLAIRCVNFAPFAQYSHDGALVFLKASYRRGKRFLLVLDLKKETYAVVHFSPSNMSYGIKEGDDGLFSVQYPDGQLRSDGCPTKLNGYGIDPRALTWRRWTPLAEGGELNLQERGLKYFFASKERIWRETLEQVSLGCISAQEFVDRNRNKALYWYSPFRADAYGHVKIMAMENTELPGRYLPVFSSRAACVDYLECRGETHTVEQIRKTSLKNVMRFLDANPMTRDYGVVVDPHEAFVAIPPGVRVTPGSLRY